MEEEEEGGKDKGEEDQEKGEEAALEKQEEPGPDGGSKGEKEEKTPEEEVKAPRAPRRPKNMQIKVTLLDDTLFECELEVRAPPTRIVFDTIAVTAASLWVPSVSVVQTQIVHQF